MFSNLNALGGAEGCWRVESLLQGLCVAWPEPCRCLQTPRPLLVPTQEEPEGGRPLLVSSASEHASATGTDVGGVQMRNVQMSSELPEAVSSV